MVRLVANSQGTDVDATNSLAQHRVPQRGRVIGSLDPMPRKLGDPLAGREPSIDELAQSGDLTRARIDEEPAHDHGG